MAFEIVARKSAYCDRNPCHRESTVNKQSEDFTLRLRQTSSNSIYPEFKEKYYNSGAVTSAVFETH